MPSPLIIRRKIDRLNRTLRFYAALDGIALLLLTVILLCILDFALDRFFEFSLLVRTLLFPVLIAAITYVFVVRILLRCFATLRRDQLATALEHFVPNLNEALVTAVEYQTADGRRQTAEEDASDSDNDYENILLQHTVDEAVAALRGVDVHRFFRTGHLFSLFLFSLLCVALTAATCVYHSETASLWFGRNILLSQQEYPRRSQLLADGFQDGRVRIGRGDSFTLSIRANMDMPSIPDAVRVRVGTPEVNYRTLRIDQFRTEVNSGRWRVFTTTFPEMLETVQLQIRGADSTLDDLIIEVVPTPTLTEMVLTQNFSDYLQRPTRTVALAGRTMIPDGTAITITAKSTKPLRKATAIINREEVPLTPFQSVNTDEPFDTIVLTLPALREETAIDFRLTDMDSLSNRHPIKAELGIIKDQPPMITARLEGIGSAITPEAVLPIVGEITDDNGLQAALHRYTTEPAVNEDTSRTPSEGAIPIAGITPGQTLFPLEQTFAAAPLSMEPDDKLVLYIEARDLFNLDASEGQVGTGPRWSLEIVTPEKLRTLLETREISLRQRFEVVIGEVERTKNILLDYSLEPTAEQIQAAEALTLELIEEETEENKLTRQAEWEAGKQKILDTISAEQSDLGKYHISRMLRDTHKEAYDLRGIVEGFRTIRAEMINNRIFTEDERRRIEQEIIQPIRELIDADFPGIDQSLGMLNGMLNGMLSELEVPSRPLVLEERQKILTQFDMALLKMAVIRDKMASMESFNEAIELLRSIIKQQQQLRNETIEERNRRLRDLLN